MEVIASMDTQIKTVNVEEITKVKGNMIMIITQIKKIEDKVKENANEKEGMGFLATQIQVIPISFCYITQIIYNSKRHFKMIII